MQRTIRNLRPKIAQIRQKSVRLSYSTFTPPPPAVSTLPEPVSPHAAAANMPENHAVVSTFDMFSIGVGPSSSHTGAKHLGPMRAAKIFAKEANGHGFLHEIYQVRVDLYGSLALTGVGHGTPGAILMGLEGESPELIEAKLIGPRVENIKNSGSLNLNGTRIIKFEYGKHMIATNEFFSVGGGFVINDLMRVLPRFLKIPPKPTTVKPIIENVGLSELPPDAENHIENIFQKSTRDDHLTNMLPFSDAQTLLEVCERENMSIAEVVFRNELQWRDSNEVKRRAIAIWNVMDASISNGISSRDEYIPGKLKVKRRAPAIYKKLMQGFAEYAGMNLSPKSQLSSSINRTLISDAINLKGKPQKKSELSLAYSNLANVPKEMKKHLAALDWVSMYALAVNEENAAGGKVVTAPTNGAAGTIPAVLKYYLEFICPTPEHAEHDILEFLFTAAAIGMLYKRGASISAAEMGCQGEVGVACSMAAAAFTAVMGGTVLQVENAAEIGMEHNLGLTCDPPEGLVVIPCIERNALAAVKAITAAQLALNGDGSHRVHLDQVIATMRQTGIDMMSKYKETSQGGLAVNVPVC
ncbi:hypothetical protein HK100_011812 [Physocladia obscura]|uniref:L-serine ammonia-lyase n=1 Tax=Physocladia obscura TaxID=109957 RepID=A0AAD5T1M5_9FUNG|nr:hypothetical protein HK100_011812 [Physocladia obscura]